MYCEGASTCTSDIHCGDGIKTGIYGDLRTINIESKDGSFPVVACGCLEPRRGLPEIRYGKDIRVITIFIAIHHGGAGDRRLQVWLTLTVCSFCGRRDAPAARVYSILQLMRHNPNPSSQSCLPQRHWRIGELLELLPQLQVPVQNQKPQPNILESLTCMRATAFSR